MPADRTVEVVADGVNHGSFKVHKGDLELSLAVDGDCLTFDDRDCSVQIDNGRQKDADDFLKLIADFLGYELVKKASVSVAPDYSCGAAFCDDPACNTHGAKDGDGLLLYTRACAEIAQ